MTAREARNRRRALERREMKLARKNVAAITTEIASEAPQPTTRAAVNRANAERSTGPRTPEGKARSARNSFKHGLYSQQLIIEGEDPAQFDQLRATLRTEHQPLNSTEEILVDELAQHFWRMRRFRALEARAWSPENLDAWCENGLLALIQRSMSSAERAFHKSLATLTKLQKDRPAHHSGFVPAKSDEAALSQPAEDFSVGAALSQPAEDFSVEAAFSQPAEDFSVGAAFSQPAEDFNVEAAFSQPAEDFSVGAALSQPAEDSNVRFVPSELHPIRTSRFDFSPTWRSLVARQLVSATSHDLQSSDR